MQEKISLLSYLPIKNKKNSLLSYLLFCLLSIKEHESFVRHNFWIIFVELHFLSFLSKQLHCLLANFISNLIVHSWTRWFQNIMFLLIVCKIIKLDMLFYPPSSIFLLLYIESTSTSLVFKFPTYVKKKKKIKLPQIESYIRIVLIPQTSVS